ncbi:divalent-cation tolerance protein CutA [Patescibacteria group bacterium AH-259-L05]|nr:divalent-cation tolerance protein CutA [Patescibacteria group bacterium AH-259-L05]
MGFIIIYITHKDEKEAKHVANHLLDKKLIACANIFPIKSLYWWKGKIQKDNEVVSLVKTQKENWNKVKSEVKKIHPYDVPCIMKLDVSANKDYEDWIKSV